MDEWKIWNGVVVRYWKLLVSGTGSLVLGIVQLVLAFVRGVESTRMILLIVSLLVFIGCFCFAFFYSWRDEYRRANEIEKSLVKEYERQLAECDIKYTAGHVRNPSERFSSAEDEEGFYCEKIRGHLPTLMKAIRNRRERATSLGVSKPRAKAYSKYTVARLE